MTEKNVELKLAKEISRRDILMALARHPNSDSIVVGSSDAKLYGFQLDDQKNDPVYEAVGHESYITGMALSRSGLVTGGFDRRLVWWDAESKMPRHTTIDAHGRFIRDVRASPDGRLLVSVGDDMIARVWDADSATLLLELSGHDLLTPQHFPSMLYACAIAPDNEHVATVDRVGKIIVWQLSNGSPVARLEAPEMYTWDPKQRRHSIGGIRSVAFSPDGVFLAVGGIGQISNIDHLDGKARVEVFDWRRGEKSHSYTDSGIKGLVEALVFHPGGDWLLAAGGDQNGFMIFFDLNDPKKSVHDEKAPMHIHALAVSEKGDAIFAAGHNKIAKWNCSVSDKSPATPDGQ